MTRDSSGNKKHNNNSREKQKVKNTANGKTNVRLAKTRKT